MEALIMTNQHESSPAAAAAAALLRDARCSKRASSIEAARKSAVFVRIWAFGAAPFLIFFGLGCMDSSRDAVAGFFMWVLAVVLIITGIALGAIIRLLADIAGAVNDSKGNES